MVIDTYRHAFVAPLWVLPLRDVRRQSQNRSAPDQRGIVDGLRRDGHEDMARVMDRMKQPE